MTSDPPFACATCIFFSENIHHPSNGQCRAKAPTLQILADGGTRTLWPLVRSHFWCGDHAVAEPVNAA